MAQAAPARWSRVHVELRTHERPALVRWTTWREDARGGFDSYLLLTEAGPVLIDPERPSDADGQTLAEFAGRRPVATILTNDMHERAAYETREQTGVPVWAPKAGEASLDGTPDHLYADGETLPGGLRAIAIPGRFAGDTVLVWTAPGGERVLFTGDTLCGAINPDNPLNAEHPRRAPGLYLGAGFPYLALAQPERLAERLRRVMDEDFDLICGAHGVPVHDAKRRLRQLLALDWASLLKEGRHPFVPA
jgi:glyoxylase-like metal-dependent hydrolase (beta-lactamase superfamily II)